MFHIYQFILDSGAFSVLVLVDIVASYQKVTTFTLTELNAFGVKYLVHRVVFEMQFTLIIMFVLIDVYFYGCLLFLYHQVNINDIC